MLRRRVEALDGRGCERRVIGVFRPHRNTRVLEAEANLTGYGGFLFRFLAEYPREVTADADQGSDL